MKNFIRLFSFVCLLIIISTCKKDHAPNPATEYIIYDNGEGSIGAGGGKITLNDKNSSTNSVSIDIPSGAVEVPTLITIRDIINELPDGVQSRINNAYEFLPDGLIFKNAINITIKVPNNIPLDSSSFLGSFDINTGYLAWNQSEVDLKERTITTEIKHFSHWVVGKVSGMKFFEKTYSYNLKNLPSNVNFSLQFLLKNDITRSFKKWEAYSKATNIYFQETASQDPDIWVGFVKTADLNLYGQLQLSGEWFGVVLYDLFSDKRFILINDDHNWCSTIALATNFSNSINNIERTLTHEIGHYFGLKDIKEFTTNSSNSLMGGTNIDVPLAICAIDLGNLKNEYPKINNLTNYQSAVDLLQTEPMSPSVYNIGQTLYNTFKVKVIDASGHGVPNVTVVFRLTTNTYTNIGNISEPVVATDDNGIATLKSLVLPGNNGTFLLTARAWLGGPINARQIDCIFNIVTTVPGGQTGSVTDIDGNVYKMVQIGTQVWMAENLKTTKYNDGTVITNVTDNTEWTGLTTGAYCDYGNIQSNSDTYGRLYNWLVAASTNPKNVCPTGWHVPSDTEWTTLENYLITNGYNYDGTTTGNKYAKSLAGTTFWDPSSTVGAVGNTDFPLYRNKSGFCALPGGDRTTSGDFEGVRLYGLFWSATASDDVSAWSRYLINSYSDVIRSVNSSYYTGFSIRCLKDN